MIVPAELSNKVTFYRPYVDAVSDHVKHTLRRYCDERGYAFTARVKTDVSLAEKLETGRYKTWSEIDDLFACAIIIPSLSEEDEVLTFLSDTFVSVLIKRRGAAKKDPSIFRFDATRYIGRLRFSQEEVAAEVRTLSFEVQVRTAFEHAWAVTTHALAYKGVTIDWRLIRLAAQLKASVEQLDGIVLGYQEAANVLTTHPWPETTAKKDIVDFFENLKRMGKIPEEVIPSNWQRFCDNLFSILRANASTTRRPADFLHRKLVEVVEAEIATLQDVSFPRSISLLQFCFGILAKYDVITPPLERYTPVITQPLLDLYPSVNKFKQIFDFELSS